MKENLELKALIHEMTNSVEGNKGIEPKNRCNSKPELHSSRKMPLRSYYSRRGLSNQQKISRVRRAAE